MDLKTKHQEALAKIKRAKNILIVSHIRPDGDAVASLCAMIEIAELFKKKYTAFCNGEVEDSFFYLRHTEKIINDKKNILFAQFDLIIVLDCGSLSRTSLEKEIKERRLGQFVIEFDHHPRVDDYANLEIRNPGAAATTEIIYNFLKANNLKINKYLANCTLTGIFTDTANLLYPNTSEQTAKISAEMMKAGAQLPQIIQNTWYNKSLAAMKIWGVALSKLQINPRYNIAFSVLTQEDIKQAGAEEINKDIYSSIAGFIGNLRQAKTIMLFTEEEIGEVKVSLRTSDAKVNVAKLAALFGGGGHTKAAGCVIKGKIIQEKEHYKII